MAKSVRLADIAKQVGVSAVTVSKALSGQKGVSEEMRQKIVALADELGYKQPSAVKKQEAVGKSYNIAVLIHEKYLDKYNSFYMLLYQNLAAHAISSGSITLMEVVTDEAESSCKVPMVLQENKADGLVLMGKFRMEYLNAIHANAQVPYIYLDDNGARVDYDSVISDSFYGAYYLTNYLFEMGHTQIGFVGNVMSTGSITDRYLGYVKSLMEHGIEVEKRWVIEDRNDEIGVMYTADELKLPKTLPTAFLCNCDLAASVIIKRLENDGYVVPDDFSVVGYDNFLYPGICDVPLTTYEVDMTEMASKCLRILLKKMAGLEYKKGANIVEGRLVIRDSVKKISE
ncbi:MAG: LacI family DNA-binding transcriptional regulator [Lachnospiraceae bacterium]|nr:LacI family DNA-binding transcriptional regulator [Lachnospiraceae bacterium]